VNWLQEWHKMSHIFLYFQAGREGKLGLLCLDILGRNIDFVDKLGRRRGKQAIQVEVTLFLLLSWKH